MCGKAHETAIPHAAHPRNLVNNRERSPVVPDRAVAAFVPKHLEQPSFPDDEWAGDTFGLGFHRALDPDWLRDFRHEAVIRRLSKLLKAFVERFSNLVGIAESHAWWTDYLVEPEGRLR